MYFKNKTAENANKVEKTDQAEELKIKEIPSFLR